MREYKYGSWDKDKKEMAYWKLPDNLYELVQEWDKCIIAEHTGFRDWYESDLIQDKRTKIVFEIVWNDRYFGWWCVSKDKHIEQPLNEMAKYCKKIGNKYEEK